MNPGTNIDIFQLKYKPHLDCTVNGLVNLFSSTRHRHKQLIIGLLLLLITNTVPPERLEKGINKPMWKSKTEPFETVSTVAAVVPWYQKLNRRKVIIYKQHSKSP
jgi:hypothetical protein